MEQNQNQVQNTAPNPLQNPPQEPVLNPNPAPQVLVTTNTSSSGKYIFLFLIFLIAVTITTLVFLKYRPQQEQASPAVIPSPTAKRVEPSVAPSIIAEPESNTSVSEEDELQNIDTVSGDADLQDVKADLQGL